MNDLYFTDYNIKRGKLFLIQSKINGIKIPNVKEGKNIIEYDDNSVFELVGLGNIATQIDTDSYKIYEVKSLTAKFIDYRPRRCFVHSKEVSLYKPKKIDEDLILYYFNIGCPIFEEETCEDNKVYFAKNLLTVLVTRNYKKIMKDIIKYLKDKKLFVEIGYDTLSPIDFYLRKKVKKIYDIDLIFTNDKKEVLI